MTEGLFITLEGGEGSGKSTLCQSMKKQFEEAGREVVLLREPGGTPFAEEMRNVYLNNEGLSGKTVALLMNAARNDNIEKIINPALSAGKVVIVDRFSGSTLVYQGIRKGQYEVVEPITIHLPMISIFVDTPPEVGLQRIADNNRETNRLDLLPLEVHQVIYDGYKELAVLKPDVYWDIVLDGTRSVSEVGSDMQEQISLIINEGLCKGLDVHEIKRVIRQKECNKVLA